MINTIPMFSRLFKGISRDEGVALMNRLGATTRKIPAGGFVFREGTIKRNIGVLLDGELEMFETDPDGRRTMVGVVKPQQSFAQVFAFADVEHHPASVVACEDSLILVIPIMHILPKPGENIDAVWRTFIHNLLIDMGNTSWTLRSRAFILSRHSTEERLMTFLREQKHAAGSSSFKIPFDRQGLADFLAVDRSALSSVISKLAKRGVLKYHKNHFTLCDVPSKGSPRS